jgi:protein-disulfide isomerase
MPFRFFMMLIVPTLSLVLGSVMAPARAQDFSPGQKAGIEQIIHDYLMKNPEVLRDAIGELERRQQAEQTAARDRALSDNAEALFRSTHQAVVGNPDGKITLVEFFDYNCGYCKKSLADVGRLMKENPDLRVVLKDFPVLGPGSLEAAQVEAAVRKQITGDKFWDFHQKVLGTRGQVGRAQVLAVAKDMGLDMSRLDRDMRDPDVRAGIAEVVGFGDKLALTGTPSWILGRDVIIGAVGYDELRDKIDNMKKCGKIACS